MYSSRKTNFPTKNPTEGERKERANERRKGQLRQSIGQITAKKPGNLITSSQDEPSMIQKKRKGGRGGCNIKERGKMVESTPELCRKVSLKNQRQRNGTSPIKRIEAKGGKGTRKSKPEESRSLRDPDLVSRSKTRAPSKEIHFLLLQFTEK